jgi:pyridoxal phosphate enzyme (YggS family)
MTRAEQIAVALKDVRGRIGEAAARAGRSPGAVRLIAVSKTMPLDDVRAALAAGQEDFGENYAQELRDKRAALEADVALRGGEHSVAAAASRSRATVSVTPIAAPAPAPRWHYLGPLQRNKVKYLAGQVALIQSVDDADILTEIDRRAAGIEGATRQACLVQINIAGETRKGGIPPHRLPAFLDRFAESTHAICTGLMLIPPFSEEVEVTRRHFAALRSLAEREARIARPHVALAELSMGMSGDFAVAIAEGATMVRVGTAIFGARPAGRSTDALD